METILKGLIEIKNIIILIDEKVDANLIKIETLIEDVDVRFNKIESKLDEILKELEKSQNIP